MPVQDPVAPPPPKESYVQKQARLKQELSKAQAQEEAPQESKSVGGFIGNVFEDAANTAKGLVDFAIWVPKRAWEVVSDPKQYWKDVQLLWGDKPGHIGDVGETLWKGIKEPYKDGIVNGLYNRPFTALLDASAVASLVGGSVSRIGRLAGGVAKVERGAKVAGAADRMVELGKTISNLPAMGLKKAVSPVGKIVPQGVKDWLGVGPDTGPVLRMLGRNVAREGGAAGDELSALAFKGLGEADRKLLNRAIRVGSKDDLAALTPEALKRFDILKSLGAEQESYLVGKRWLSRPKALIANAKAAALELFGDASRKNWKKAAKMVVAGEIDPLYATLFQVPERMLDFFSSMSRDLGLARSWGRLDKRVARGLYEKDPAKYAPRQIQIFHHLKARLDWMDETLQYLKERNKAFPVIREGDVPAGMAVIPDVLLKKYLTDRARAASVATSNLAKGMSPSEAAAATYKALTSDPKFMQEVNSAKGIAVPRHVAALIARELKLPGPLARIYDRGMSYWKAAATIFSPRYWSTTAIGNGFLMALYGVDPVASMRARRMQEFMPPELRSRMQSDLLRTDVNAYERVSQNIGQYASKLDNIGRQGIFASEVEAARLALGQTGKEFFQFADDAPGFLREISMAPEEMGATLREIQRLEENAALRVPALVEFETALNAEIGKIERLESAIKGKVFATQKRYALDRRKLKAGQLEDKLKRLKAGLRSSLDAQIPLRERLPMLKARSEIADKAIDLANSYFGNYLGLHPVQRDWFRRAVPFWVFTKTMLQLAFRLPFMQPKRMFMWNRLNEVIQDAFNDDEVPAWLAEYTPVGITRDGSVVMIRLRSFDPFSGAERTASIGGQTIPALGAVWLQNPLVKVGYELIGGTNHWTKRPWDTSEYMTRLDNGEVYEYKDGRLRKTLAAPSFWRSVWYLWPQAQLIEEATIPYRMTDRGWLLDPEPIKAPDGSIMYPEGLWKGALGFLGIPRVQVKNMDEEKAKERMKVMRIMRSFRDGLRRMPPEKREAAMQVLNDWGNDEIKRVER
ncbi:hypothetical protein [Glutamicibacter sp.]|jgi:hypothetical protein|uniref:hypothetical protein n=1 Tax=Glutamicibacter sp. TaxID=1931995 RepID=UPI002FD9AA44